VPALEARTLPLQRWLVRNTVRATDHVAHSPTSQAVIPMLRLTTVLSRAREKGTAYAGGSHRFGKHGSNSYPPQHPSWAIVI
jgi:hypothetical protein